MEFSAGLLVHHERWYVLAIFEGTVAARRSRGIRSIS